MMALQEANWAAWHGGANPKLKFLPAAKPRRSMGGKCLLLRVIFEIKAITAQIDIETYVIEVTDFNSEVRFDL